MPGIVGVVEARDSERLEARVQGMIARMERRPNYTSTVRTFDGCALGKLSIYPEKAIAEADGTAVVCWGIIHELPSGVPVTEHLLALYRRGGPRALAGLNGIYTVAVWDSSQRQLVLVNDRYGFKKIHYYHSGDLFLVASEYKAFVGQPGFNGVVDPEGVAQLMEVGYPLDDRTLFRDVKLLPPASILTWRDGRIARETYWDYVFGEGDGRPEDYVDEFAERLKTAVMRQARDGMCVQVSGGLDSRALVGTVEKHCPGMRVQGVTVGDAWAHDVKFGRRMALNLGYEHTAVPVPEDCYERFLPLGVARTEGSISCVNYFIFSMDEWLTSSGAPALMNGFLGGCLTGAHLHPEVAAMTDPEEALEWLVRKFYRAMFREHQREKLYQPHLADDLRDTTARAIRACFERRKDLSLLNRSDYVDLHQRQRRFQSSHIDFWSPVCDVLDPFADNELLDFELSVPPKVRMTRRHYVEMIRRHLPKVARIPKSSTGIPLLASKPRELLIRARMRLYYRVLPKLTFGRCGGGNLASPFDSNQRMRTASRDFLAGLLGRRDLLEDLFNMDTVTRILQEYFDGEDWNAGQVAMLMTFAEWRRQYGAGVGTPSTSQTG